MTALADSTCTEDKLQGPVIPNVQDLATGTILKASGAEFNCR